MNNTIFYLIGTKPSLRLAIAEEIAARTGARIVDSQALYGPIFNVVEQRKPAEMPDGVWEQIDVVRGAVLKAIETQSPKDWNFVFTHAGLDIPADVGVYRAVRDTARRRGSRFVPVTLTGAQAQRLLRFDEADALTLDMTAATPADAVKRIVASAAIAR